MNGLLDDAIRPSVNRVLEIKEWSLVDRFRIGLPAYWRPKSSYHVRTEPVRADEVRHAGKLPVDHRPVFAATSTPA